MAQNDKKILHVMPYISGVITHHMIFIYDMVQVCKRIISPGFFLHFPSGVKGQKPIQNDKKICLSHSISQKASIIWSSFLVHLCKMMTLPDANFVFSKFLFSGLLEGGSGEVKGQKMSQNDNKFCLSHMSVVFGTHVSNYNLYSSFFHFFKFWFVLVFRGGGKGKKMTHNYRFQSTRSMFQEP